MAAIPPQPLRASKALAFPQEASRMQASPARSPGRIAQIVLAFAIAVAVLGQGISTPFIKDAEPQSAQWIVDIVANGNWLLPQDYYHLVNRKPPLFYWLSAIVAKTTGGQVDEARSRAVSLVAGAALAAEVMAWTGSRLGPCAGWIAFVFILGTYGFAARATVALTDMLLTFLLFSTYIIVMPQIVLMSGDAPPSRIPGPKEPASRRADGRRGEREAPASDASSWRTITAGTLLGLAILTKGPVAAMLSALAVFIFLILVGKNPLQPLMREWPWVVLALSLAVACTWYVPALMAGSANNLDKVFFQENLGHFLPAGAGGTGEAARPFYYMALRVIGGSLPLSLLIPAVALSCPNYAKNVRHELLYQLAMALAVLLLFSLASAKRDDYVLPALPPLAILFAAQFVLTDSGTQRLAARFRDAAVTGAATTILLGSVALLISGRDDAVLHMLGGRLASSDESYAAIFTYGIAHFHLPFVVFLVMVLAGAGLALAGVYYAHPPSSGAGFGLVSVAITTLWIGTLKPLEASTRSVAVFAQKVRAQVTDAPIFVAHPDPEFAWYFGRGVPMIPRAIAAGGPARAEATYFVGRPRDLLMIAPLVRKRMRRVIQSHVQGAGGSPALYLLTPR
jgi:4-amino-4-deoxy-L-arabinose transferase-like glycosyltransferase